MEDKKKELYKIMNLDSFKDNYNEIKKLSNNSDIKESIISELGTLPDNILERTIGQYHAHGVTGIRLWKNEPATMLHLIAKSVTESDVLGNVDKINEIITFTIELIQELDKSNIQWMMIPLPSALIHYVDETTQKFETYPVVARGEMVKDIPQFLQNHKKGLILYRIICCSPGVCIVRHVSLEDRPKPIFFKKKKI